MPMLNSDLCSNGFDFDPPLFIHFPGLVTLGTHFILRHRIL